MRRWQLDLCKSPPPIDRFVSFSRFRSHANRWFPLWKIMQHQNRCVPFLPYSVLLKTSAEKNTHIYINRFEGKNANHLILSHKKAGYKNRLISKYCGSIIKFSDRAYDQACTFQNDRFWIEHTASWLLGIDEKKNKTTAIW